MKSYFYACTFILLLVVLMGYALPLLYSSDDDFLLFMFPVTIFLSLPIFYWLGKNIWKNTNHRAGAEK